MPRSILDDSYDPIYDQIRGILGEHFEHWCFIVMDEQGEVFFDYDHLPSGRMLINEMYQEVRMDDNDLDIDWDIDEDTDGSIDQWN
jgi:hypothetical protein|tara:strand:+ start:699 stop:956 length:258 start_codon:yes stop_codon:yes gene_type:complete